MVRKSSITCKKLNKPIQLSPTKVFHQIILPRIQELRTVNERIVVVPHRKRVNSALWFESQHKKYEDNMNSDILKDSLIQTSVNQNDKSIHSAQTESLRAMINNPICSDLHIIINNEIIYSHKFIFALYNQTYSFLKNTSIHVIEENVYPKDLIIELLHVLYSFRFDEVKDSIYNEILTSWNMVHREKMTVVNENATQDLFDSTSFNQVVHESTPCLANQSKKGRENIEIDNSMVKNPIIIDDFSRTPNTKVAHSYVLSIHSSVMEPRLDELDNIDPPGMDDYDQQLEVAHESFIAQRHSLERKMSLQGEGSSTHDDEGVYANRNALSQPVQRQENESIIRNALGVENMSNFNNELALDDTFASLPRNKSNSSDKSDHSVSPEPGSTPQHQSPAFIKLKTVFDTPLINSLSTPEIMKSLSEFGIRNNVPKKRAKILMTQIHREIRNNKDAIVTPLRKKSRPSENLPILEEGARSHSEVENVDPLISEQQQTKLENINKYKFKSTKNEVTNQELIKCLKNNSLIYTKILSSIPVDLDEISDYFKIYGFKMSQQKLITFLDEECVTFTDRKQRRKLTVTKSQKVDI